jgi:hypothetical protein
MIDQRAVATGEGLPRTACAPDLFTRIDALKGKDSPHAEWPVRFYLGFGTPLPDFQQLRGDGFVWQVVVALGGKPGDGAILRRGKDLATGVIIMIVWMLGFLADVMTSAKLAIGGKNDPAIKEISADIAAKELTARLSGSDPTWATAIDQLARNYLVPTVTIDAGQAVSAYLAGVIDVTAAHDYSRMQAVCDLATDAVIDTQQSRLAAAELLDAARRGIITDERADAEIRQLGWLKSEYVEWQRELAKWVPDQGFFVGWMLRGTTHDSPAKGWELDKYFEASYGEQEKKWAKAAGLSDEQVKWLWRSQYQPVDLGQAYDWFRRSAAGLLPAGAEFTPDDLAQAIRRSTIPPAYHATAMQSVWTPLSARLLRVAFDEGLVEQGQVIQALITEGYSPADAQTLFSEWAKLKPAYTARKIGAMSIGQLHSLYADAVIGTKELAAGLALLGLDESEGPKSVAIAKQMRVHKHRAAVLSALRASYMAGAIGEPALLPMLAYVGLDGDDVADIAGHWRTEFEARPRPDAASDLGKAFQSGLINETEYVASLTQLRYSPEQIARILYAAEAANWGKKMRDAEMLVKHAQSSLTGEHKRWADEIKQAEKLAGKVEQRTRTSAGKLMSWIKGRVAKPPKKVSEKGPANGTVYTASDAALAQAEAFVEKGDGGIAPSGTGIAVEGTPGGEPTGASPG